VRCEVCDEAVDVDARHEEVRILRFASEQGVTDRAADDVGVEAE
jgi:hypothetical protein